MKHIKATLILLLFTFALPSCHDACEFEQNDEKMEGKTDDNERKIMDGCHENAFTSKESIEKNLIGKWELVGFAHGWLPTISQPCSSINISENKLVLKFKNSSVDTVSTHSWEVVATKDNESFYLNITPTLVSDLSIAVFCENYMYCDGTFADRNMYLYKKVK